MSNSSNKQNPLLNTLVKEKWPALQNGFRTGLGLQNLINRYKTNSKKSTNNYISILKELDKLTQYKSLFSSFNQTEINKMRKEIENLLKFENKVATFFNSSYYKGNVKAFKDRVKNKYPNAPILRFPSASLSHLNQDNFSKANFTNIYMNHNQFTNNNNKQMFPVPGNILLTKKKYYFNHEHKLQRLFNPNDPTKYYRFKVPYKYSRHIKSIETKLQEQFRFIFDQLVNIGLELELGLGNDKYLNINRISVKENDEMIIRLFGNPLTSKYKYFIERNKNNKQNTLTYSVQHPNRPKKLINIPSLVFTVRNGNTNNSKLQISIPIKLIKNKNKYQFELLNNSYKNKLNKYKVY